MGLDILQNTSVCLDEATITGNQYRGSVVENSDGSVSVYINGGKNLLILSKTCCEAIRTAPQTPFTFDINTQTCRWGPEPNCDIKNVFKIVLNPNNDDGTYFNVEDNQNCLLSIDFDYLFKVKCESFLPSASTISFLETFDVSLTLDVSASTTTYKTLVEFPLFNAIGVGKLYQYLTTNTDSGFYVCGDPTPSENQTSCTPLSLNISGVTQPNVFNCGLFRTKILNDLYLESGLNSQTEFANMIPSNALASKWLHYNTVISDPTILNDIIGKKIKISLKINNANNNFCVLMDDIVLNKLCTSVEKSNLLITKSPGFEFDRIRDNKKSWVGNTTLTNRPFSISRNNSNNSNSIRQTNYDVNDERLVINSKEIDLDISLASAIETDVWCYVVDNPCLLTGITSCDPCISVEVLCGNKNFMDGECFDFMDGEFYDFMDGNTIANTGLTPGICCGDNKIDFNKLLTQPLSDVTTIEDFEYFLTSELIDAKNRKTLSGYPTLRALYDRYMNSGLYCNTNSSRFDYLTMEQFANLVGNYWVDIVEQVIPATTIWGSTKIYSNTIFDQQKFKYKSYSSLFCGNQFSCKIVPSPINGTNGLCEDVSVTMTTLLLPSGNTLSLQGPITTCDSICLAQMNSGSEFIGNVTIIGLPPDPCAVTNTCDIASGPIYVGENTLDVTVIINYSDVIINNSDVSLLVQGFSQPVTYLWSNGVTTETVSLVPGEYWVEVSDECNTIRKDFIIPELVACWYTLPDQPFWIDDAGGFVNYTFSVESFIRSGVEIVVGSEPTITLNVVPVWVSTPYGNTYTEFVDFLNNIVFPQLGLTNYSAQVSQEIFGCHNSDGEFAEFGFYIIRPEGEEFSMKVISESYDIVYTNNSIYEVITLLDVNGNSSEQIIDDSGYKCIKCNNIIVNNGVVSEPWM